MDVNLSRAANAYLRQMQLAGDGDGDAGATEDAGGTSFSGMLAGALEKTKDTLEKSEQLRLQAVAGKADIAELVTAVSEAELAVNTVVAVRDRVIGAYQEILRMPI